MNHFRSILKRPLLSTTLGLTLLTGTTYTYYKLSQPLPPLSLQQTVAEQMEQLQKQNEVALITSKNVEKGSATVQMSTINEGEREIEEKREEEKNGNEGEGKSQRKEEEVGGGYKDPEVFRELREVRQLQIEELGGHHDRVLIVADLPFNPQFQHKIIQQINTLKHLYPDLVIYRKDLSSKQTQQQLSSLYNVKIKDQTLFLLKSPLQSTLTPIDFDIYIQYPSLMSTYLKQIKGTQNTNQIKQKMIDLNPHQSILVYLYDENEEQPKKKERFLVAKYIQMQMAINNMNGVKMVIVDKQAAIKSGIVSEDNARVNSVHLYRKHNIYTPYEPNFYLNPQGSVQSSIPFHRLTDIALFAKGNQNLLISHYLAGLETFDAMANPAPFHCTLRIDKNKISQEEYNRLLKIFGQLKSQNIFPDIAYSLKLKPIPYAGPQVPKNKQWQITLSNVDQMDKQAMMHQIKTKEQRQKLGFKEETYLTESNQYLYEHMQADFGLIREFLEKGVKGQLEKYYKSQEEHPMAAVRGVNGKQFGYRVMDNDKDHFVYEYSQFCPTCKRISPIIAAFANVIQEKGMGLQGLNFHKYDANKNRTKGQLSSPYIPNIFYYKNQWKKDGPVRFPIQMLGQQGLRSLYTFCAITHELKHVEWSAVERAIRNKKRVKLIL